VNASGARPPWDFARLFAEQRDAVRHQLARMVSAAEVEDLMQAVFVKAARALPRFRADAEIATWLHRIASRTAIDHLRSRHHHETQRTISLARESEHPACERECGGATGAPASAVAPEASRQIVRAEMHSCIREYIRRLPPGHAEVLTLKEIEELTNPELADRLGISLEAAKIRLHRARKAMRALLDEGCDFYRTDENTLACDRKSGRCPK
jgi:RNA polymerase sigma-70 factor, ECF subfamily